VRATLVRGQLCMLEETAVHQIDRDRGRAERMTAEFGCDARRGRPAPDQELTEALVANAKPVAGSLMLWDALLPGSCRRGSRRAFSVLASSVPLVLSHRWRHRHDPFL
jgi:hypothetical protein